MAYSRPTASNTKYPHKSQSVTSDNYQVTVHIIPASVWSLVHQFSHRRAAVHATWSIASPMTRWCRPEQITQQSGAAEVLILTKNLYKFHVFGGTKLIREFSDKRCNVKSLNKLLKKVRYSGSMRRRTGSGRRHSVRSDASLVFTRYSTNT